MANKEDNGGGSARGDGDPTMLRVLASWLKTDFLDAIQHCSAALQTCMEISDHGWNDWAGKAFRLRMREGQPGIWSLRDVAKEFASELRAYADQLEAGQAEIDKARASMLQGDARMLQVVDGEVIPPEPDRPPPGMPVYDREDRESKDHQYYEQSAEDYEKKAAAFKEVQGLVVGARDKVSSDLFSSLCQEVGEKSFLLEGALVAGTGEEIAKAFNEYFVGNANLHAKISGQASHSSWMAWRAARDLELAKHWDQIDYHYDFKGWEARVRGGQALKLKSAFGALGCLIEIYGVKKELDKGHPPARVMITTGAGVGASIAAPAAAIWIGLALPGGALVILSIGAGFFVDWAAGQLYDNLYAKWQLPVVIDEKWYVR